MTTSFTDAVVRYLLEPYQSVDTVLVHIIGPLTALTDLNSKSAWLYLLSGLLVARLVFRQDRRLKRIGPEVTFWCYIFPKGVYLHPSAILDYKYVFIDFALRPLTYLPLIVGFTALFYKACLAVIPPYDAAKAISHPTLLTFVVAFLLMDFGFFLSHYVMHRIPLLWAFHQVHHSAVVLTPVTVHRIHPVETLVSGVVSSLLTGAAAAFYTVLSDEHLNLFTLFGVNILTFAFFLTGNVLRHTHIWLSYGPWLSRILISPAQHQIHHSVDVKHWDKNFGYVLAIWDVVFGTLYIPRSRETLGFGIPELAVNKYASLSALYLTPFFTALNLIRRSGKRTIFVRQYP